MRTTILIFFLWLAIPVVAISQQTVRVPADFPSIQQAIDGAAPGSTIAISPGTYSENIDFLDKPLTVEGVGQRDKVILDGGFRGSVVRFSSGEGRDSILQNLTVQHGGPADINDRSTLTAGGIFINNASPTLNQVVVTDNIECGIGAFDSSPLIENSTVQNTTHMPRAYGCPVHNVSSEFYSQSLGTGIFVYGHMTNGLTTQITGNIIMGNTAIVPSSAGIEIIDAGTVQIKNNSIHGNKTQGIGGGIGLFGSTTGLITQNLIFSNVVDPTNVTNPAVQDAGAGINIEVTSDNPTNVADNTIAYNRDIGGLLAGTQVYVGPTGSISFSNNLLIGEGTSVPLQCESAPPGQPQPVFTFSDNDVYAPGAMNNYGGICTNFATADGDFTADPMFSGNDNFELSLPSPAIDRGNNLAEGVGPTDFAGAPRIQNATGAPHPTIDLGAYEHAGINAVPPSPYFTLKVVPANVNLSKSSSATVSVIFVPNSTFQSKISLACASLPATISCKFTPITVEVGAGLPQTATLTIAKVQPGSAQAAFIFSRWREGLPFAICGCLFTFGTRRRNRMHRFLTATIAATATFPLIACGVHAYPHVQNVIVSVTATPARGQQQTAALSVESSAP